MIGKAILILLCVLPFSAVFFMMANLKIDIWHSQGYFAQAGILILYCIHLFKKNKPLSLLLLWSGLLTFYLFVNIHSQTQQYAALVFFPFFNFLCMVILFDIITSYLNKKDFEKIYKYLSLSVAIVLVYCVLQKLNLDQFYRSMNDAVLSDSLVGTVGNTMHLSHYLAICIPFFLINNKVAGKIGVLATLGIIILSGSSSGLFVALAVLAFYSCFFPIFNKKEIILLVLIGAIALVVKHPDIPTLAKDLIYSNGRMEIWKKYLPIFAEKPITGWGLGIVNGFAQKEPVLGWRHLHNEFFHYAVELGLIGVGFIIWGIVDFFRRLKKEKLSVISASVFLGFILTSLFGYPSHLWLLSSMGLISYSYFYTGEE